MGTVNFSVIMPAYNAQGTIKAAIESVVRQTCQDFELIVVDDCSTDNTRAITQQSANGDSRIRVLATPRNLGVAGARNVAIAAASGRYIAFLDSDDLWFPKKLEKQLECHQSGALVVYAGYERVAMDGARKIIRVPGQVGYQQLLRGNVIANLTGSYDAFSLGKYYQKSIGHEDYLMWLQIVKKSEVAHAAEGVFASYRVSGESLSSNKLRGCLWTWRIYRNEIGIPFFPALISFLCYVARATVKHR